MTRTRPESAIVILFAGVSRAFLVLPNFRSCFYFLNQRMKTIVQRTTGPARRDDLPWSKAKIDLDRSTGMQNTSDKKRISQAEMSITRISFIQHIPGNLQGKTGSEVGSDT